MLLTEGCSSFLFFLYLLVFNSVAFDQKKLSEKSTLGHFRYRCTASQTTLFSTMVGPGEDLNPEGGPRSPAPPRRISKETIDCLAIH